jgi:hypothetical protein
VPFSVPGTVFPLTVGLVLRLTFHPGTVPTCVCAVRIDVIYMDYQPTTGDGLRARRTEIVFRIGARIAARTGGAMTPSGTRGC